MIPLDDVLTTVTTWCGDLHITREPPDYGREWVDLGALAQPEPAQQSVAAMLAADACGDRGVAGAFHGLYLAHAVAGPLAAAAIGLHTVWTLDDGPVHARVHPDGRWFDAVAIVGARHRCAAVKAPTTGDDVLAAAAAGLIAFLDPIFTRAAGTRPGSPGTVRRSRPATAPRHPRSRPTRRLATGRRTHRHEETPRIRHRRTTPRRPARPRRTRRRQLIVPTHRLAELRAVHARKPSLLERLNLAALDT